MPQVGVVVAAATLFTLGVTSPSPATSRMVGQTSADAIATPIRHVVIIYQENHSFDDVLGRVCGLRSTPCNGSSEPVTFADGKTARNIPEPDIVPVVTHNEKAQRLGMQNQWDLIPGCTRRPYSCVSHVRPRRIPNLVRLANTFTVSDATFASNPLASFGMHVALTAGTVNGYLDGNPHPSRTGEPAHSGWGCSSHKDMRWAAPGGSPQLVPSCVPTRNGNGPYRSSPVPYVPTIMERFEQAGLRWHIYQAHDVGEDVVNVWSICSYFHWCEARRSAPRYTSSTRDFVRAARAGRLPKLSLMMPSGNVSQHNRRSMTKGDNYLGRILQGAMNGPQWRHTAIFITYDDCGCFYDHVQPPPGLGIRNPMVIVSPWARPTYTDSTVAVQPYSMLAFLQHNFGLQSLSDNVDTAYDYFRAFDFTQQPLGGVPMTHTSISREERRRLAKMPPMEDPT
jgi:phospholipase C